MKKPLVVFGLLLLLFIFLTPVSADPGDLDSSFGKDGIVYTTLSGWDRGQEIVQQADGKLVATALSESPSGEAVLIRYDESGVIDKSFGENGVAAPGLPFRFEVYGLAQQSDGGLLAVGSSSVGYSGFAVVRYDKDGMLDLDFGNGGSVITYMDGSAGAARVRVLDDGRFIVMGHVSQEGASPLTGLVRYTATGFIDETFGSNGKLIIEQFSDPARDILVQPDGKLLLVGRISGDTGTDDFGIVRYHLDGNIDTSFGNNGLVTTDFGGNDRATTIALQSDSRVIVAGTSYTDDNQYMVMARYHSDGSLDESFGIGGRVSTDLGDESEGTEKVLLHPFNRIVLVGGFGSDLAVLRYTMAGALDETFGNGGIALIAMGGMWAFVGDTILQADHKLVTVGAAGHPAGSSIMLARFENQLVLPPVFYLPAIGKD